MKKYRFSVVERDEEGYFAFCPELQGCYTQGMTYEEVLENIHDPPYPGAPSIGGGFQRGPHGRHLYSMSWPAW
jgi:hypothetical protein